MTINETNTTGTGNNQAIGTAVIVSGSVQVESPDGATRVLQVNGVVFANETITTGGTGKVSIIFNDAAHTQLDLGRMSEVVLDGDVYPGDQPVDLADVVSEVAQLQEALLEGDPTQDLPAPAAGPAAGGTGARGGGHPTVVFDLTGAEVIPTSGAETIGVSRSFLNPELPIGEEELVVEAAAIEPPEEPEPPGGGDIEIIPENYFPEAGDYSSVVDEANFLDGTEPVSTPLTVSGGLTTLGIDFGGDGPGSITIDGQSLDIDNLNGTADDFITVTGTYGSLQMWDDGSWTYTITTNIEHPIADATGAADSLPDLFTFTVFDSNGDSATGTLTINILDDGPEASDLTLTRVVEEEALDNYLSGDPNIVGSNGNPDENDGPEDSDFNSLYQNDATQVSGTLAPLVTMGADNPGTFSWGSLLDLPTLSSQGGEVVYQMNANGTTLEAWVHDSLPARISSDFTGGEGDRLVFTLDLQPDGSYVFTLLDQLDHVSGDGENTALLLWGDGAGSVPSLDLSTAIIATDSDDDSTGLAPGALSFLIVDDVPVLVPNIDNEGGMAFGWVDEDALNHNTGDGDNNPDDDYSIGNEDGWDTDQTIMDLSGLVKVGTDEQLTWSIADPLGVDSGLTSDNAPVYYHLVEGVLVATTSATAPTSLAQAAIDGNIFTFSVDEYGYATFNLNDQLDHGDPGPDGIYGTADDAYAGDTGTLTIDNLGQFVLATDFDGDSVNLDDRINITVENDVPILLLSTPELDALASTATRIPLVNMEVHEDALGNEEDDLADDDTDASLGNWDAEQVNTDTATYDLSQFVKVGADEELSWSLIPQDGPIETSLLSGGETVFYAIDGNILTAYTASVSSVFTFSVDADTGEAIFNLNDQLDHPDGSGDEAILTIDDLGQFVRATDTDGDYVEFTGLISVTVENDVPETGDPQYAILANEAGNTLVADLAIEIGADEPGTEMALNPFYNGEMVGDGDFVRDNISGEILTYQGENLTWLQNSDSSWAAVVGGEEIFKVTLEEDSSGVYTGNYTVELLKELDGNFVTEEFSLSPPYGPPTTELVFTEGDLTMTFTGVNPNPDGGWGDTVNWNAQGIGVGNTFVNEDVDGDEILTATFTNSIGEAMLVRSATFGIDHNDEYQQGSGTLPEVVHWIAYDDDGNIVGEGSLEGEMQGSTWQWDQEITIDSSNTTDEFSSVAFTAETTNPEGIRVVPMEVTYEEDADHQLTFVVDGEDSDGDAIDQVEFDVTFDGEGDIVGTEADEVIVGSSGDDVIYGGEGDDVIFGGEGDDVIYGGEGDDILLGGAEEVPPATDEEGNDIIYGDDGADTFDTSEEGAGEVQDYEPDPPPAGDDDELADLVPPVIP